MRGLLEKALQTLGVRICPLVKCVHQAPGGRRKRPPRKERLSTEKRITIKVALTFQQTFGLEPAHTGPDEYQMSEGELLLDNLAATIGSDNGAKEALLLRFNDPETGEESQIYRCVLVDEA